MPWKKRVWVVKALIESRKNTLAAERDAKSFVSGMFSKLWDQEPPRKDTLSQMVVKESPILLKV